MNKSKYLIETFGCLALAASIAAGTTAGLIILPKMASNKATTNATITGTTMTASPQQRKKSTVEIGLENTCNFWKKMGVNCDGSCIPEGLRYYENSSTDGSSLGLANGIRFQGTINRSETRHAGMMGVTVPPQRVFVQTTAQKSTPEIELKNTCNFWKRMGVNCNGLCVHEGLQYYESSSTDGSSLGLANGIRFQGTINRSETRHAGMMGVTAPSKELTAE